MTYHARALHAEHGVSGLALTPRQHRGKTAYLSGLAAEDSVERHYVASGADVLCRRWRGAGAEIDLILERDGVLIFAEVKSARDFATAAQRLGRAQILRIMRAAEVFAAGRVGGAWQDMRIDAALVDGQGRVEILENVSMMV